MTLEASEPAKGKGVALKTTNSGNDEESLAETVNLLAKNFNKTLKKFNKKPFFGGSTPGTVDRRIDRGWKNSKFGGSSNAGTNNNQSNGIQCRECEGFGHIQVECPNYVKKQSKSYYTSLSDEETDEEEENNTEVSNFVAFTAHDVQESTINPIVNDCDPDSMSEEEEELTEEELMANYQLLFDKWSKLTKTYTSGEIERNTLKKRNKELEKMVEEQKLEIRILENKLERMTRGINMMNSSTPILDEILSQGKRCGDNSGIGYNHANEIKNNTPGGRTFIAAGSHSNQVYKRKHYWRCHHCGKKGHIAPYCYKIYGKGKNKYSLPRIYMTGNRANLTSIKEVKADFVTFGGGEKGKIIGKGALNVEGLPNLEEVLLVEGLTENLISISQLYDSGLKVAFDKNTCSVSNQNNDLIMQGSRSTDNCYLWTPYQKALSSRAQGDVELWHKRLGHTNYRNIRQLISRNAVRGLPHFVVRERICGEYQIGKQTRVSHQQLQHVLTTRVLELLHMDLMGPIQVESIAGRKEREANILVIRSDHGREFENIKFQTFYDEVRIKHEYSAPITPQQNGIVERTNRTLQEMASVMLHAKELPIKFWAEAVNTACHIHNRVTLRPGTHSTSYELWLGRKSNVHYFHVFGITCYILTDREPRQKFDVRSDEGIFLGYSRNSRALRVYNKQTHMVMESINVKVVDQDASMMDEEDIPPTLNPLVIHSQSSEGMEDKSDIDSNEIEPAARIPKNHPVEHIIGELDQGITTRKKDKVDYRKMAGLLGETCFISKVERKDVKAVLLGEYWITAMQEELIQFDKNDVWELVPRPPGCNVIGTKWIFKNKMDESGNVTRNKARLVAQGYTHIEGIEAIRLLLSIACLLKFKLFQMDVKSAFLNGVVQEEVYVEQPKEFIDVQYPEHVYKLKKALYGLKQAPRAWYERLTVFLLNNGYSRGGVDNTLFIKREKNQMMVAQIYVDDIVFEGVSNHLVKQFVQQMEAEFEMSVVGELKYFLGFQINQMEDSIFISQANYAKNMMKKFGLESSKTKRTPFATHLKVTKDEDGKAVDVRLYRSMIGSLLYLTASRPDIAHSVGVCARYQANPKESHLNIVKRILKYVQAEAEYMAAGSSCTQLIWMKQMLEEYGVKPGVMTLYCDNMSAISISKNPVQHSRTKHIDIRHHFIRNLVEDGVVKLEHVSSDKQLADILTKGLEVNQFEDLKTALGLCVVNK
ncbi:transmembrane signal receptor [Lithospermum erythrorhizon]|uniref:Transmembrane signal receptor n=1 Tax=Lithospermum erythrorhizon TaxID=34254 RepID=A0AAV3RZV2_LITER